MRTSLIWTDVSGNYPARTIGAVVGDVRPYQGVGGNTTANMHVLAHVHAQQRTHTDTHTHSQLRTHRQRVYVFAQTACLSFPLPPHFFCNLQRLLVVWLKWWLLLPRGTTARPNSRGMCSYLCVRSRRNSLTGCLLLAPQPFATTTWFLLFCFVWLLYCF